MVLVFGGLLAGCDRERDSDESTIAADAANGREIIAELGCGACHIIPGIAGARGTVGPSLAGFDNRNFIAGTLPNRPSDLAAFVRNAPDFMPETAMPPIPMTEDEALDVAAYLLTLD